tara:strand:+ start:12325 stop:12561 length:237 start_codon:yes stop_codon:yes gene_type:complete
MTKQNIRTWLLLLTLTVIAGLVSSTNIAYAIPLILVLAVLKFMGVAFSFMEMKKANLFWKVLIVSFLVVFCGIILIAI